MEKLNYVSGKRHNNAKFDLFQNMKIERNKQQKSNSTVGTDSGFNFRSATNANDSTQSPARGAL